MNSQLPENVLNAIENTHIQAIRMRKILDDMLQLYQLEEIDHSQKNLTQFCLSTLIYTYPKSQDNYFTFGAQFADKGF